MKGKPISDIFGMNSFNDEAMKKYLPYKTYEALKKIVKEGGRVEPTLAEEVAQGLKEWAIDRGATHFTHWFHPMTGLTAEKHDSFLSFSKDGKVIERFSGNNLIQGEPDASSFPSGGLRSTFEARGYTAWDPTSPAFLSEGVNGTTLCIPCVFLSYTGQALDKKAPLLRSMDRLSEIAVKILHLFGNKKVTRVFTTVGPEQEYFLVDKAYYNRRPDLIITGRTLFGAKPPKGQEMEDHYFGSIRERILAFMHDAELDLFKLGIPVKTRHNEVAPAQFEIAPLYEDSNIATDHNQIVMEILKKVANRHNLALLLHEKPFLGINGSGKHNNWSMADSEGNNLLEPGKTPHANLQFLVFLIATMKAVYKYSDLLRATVATAGNDHRLGANEAPPAIISVFLGEQLTKILDNLEVNKETDYSDKAIIDLGISKMPAISRDNSDRNRTSPFAFTGNKFEFRAVGSSHSIAMANYTLNVMVTDILNEFYNEIESNLKKEKDFNKAVLKTIIQAITETKPVRFEGNNYDTEWEKEAMKRGLPNKKNTPESLKDLISSKNKKIFAKLNVLSEVEVESIYTILLEQYIKVVNIEAETALMMAKTLVLPAAVKYQSEIAESVQNLITIKGINDKVIEKETEMVSLYSKLVSELYEKICKLDEAMDKKDNIKDEEQKADYFCGEILPQMLSLRETVDIIEEHTGDEYWILPKYREMLFVY
ncbi:MAG TPA: glutamine synthetase type III [Elusimicrobia bacterium]|nr:MAG: glutamine synthetase [Elusimicrobia bacterium RIFOXYD2_FULL_34_30]HAM38301.1 glutamine synthetase type III [Elusimicrobiota bacterium]